MLKMFSMNSSNIKGKVKKGEYISLIEKHDPHIIIGCELKLSSSLPTYILSAENYNVQWKDCMCSVIHNDLASS